MLLTTDSLDAARFHDELGPVEALIEARCNQADQVCDTFETIIATVGFVPVTIDDDDDLYVAAGAIVDSPVHLGHYVL